MSNKLVDNLKCENESLKIHAKCLIAEPIAKNEDNICCNHVVVLDFMPNVSSTSKDKSVYIPPHKRNQKVERNALKPKPLFRSYPRELSGFKFVPICHHCGVIGHIRPQCHKLKREQTYVARFLPKRPSGPKHIVVPLVILDLIALSFKFLKESKEKRNLKFMEVVLKRVNRI